MITYLSTLRKVQEQTKNEIKQAICLVAYTRKNIRLTKKQYTESVKLLRRMRNISKLTLAGEMTLRSEISMKHYSMKNAEKNHINVQLKLAALRKKKKFYESYLVNIYLNN